MGLEAHDPHTEASVDPRIARALDIGESLGGLLYKSGWRPQVDERQSGPTRLSRPTEEEPSSMGISAVDLVTQLDGFNDPATRLDPDQVQIAADMMLDAMNLEFFGGSSDPTATGEADG